MTIDALAQAKKITLNKGDTALIINTAYKHNVLRNQLAYLLASTWHETAFTMKPVTEYGSQKYLRGKKYWPFIGRGYIQLTWKFNYESVGKKIGVDLVTHPEKALEPQIAAEILVQGVMNGWFVPAHPLTRYVTLQKSDYYNARRSVNGLDKAAEIAVYAKRYEELLKDIGYGEEPPKDYATDKAKAVPAPKQTLLQMLVNAIRAVIGKGK